MGPRRGELVNAPDDVPVVGQAVVENEADSDQARSHHPSIKHDAKSEQISAIADSGSLLNEVK
jgi:hypothetical protein